MATVATVFSHVVMEMTDDIAGADGFHRTVITCVARRSYDWVVSRTRWTRKRRTRDHKLIFKQGFVLQVAVPAGIPSLHRRALQVFGVNHPCFLLSVLLVKAPIADEWLQSMGLSGRC